MIEAGTIFTWGVPSLAGDLGLKPQARKVLAHMESGRPITPLKAQSVYGIWRLAASIYELRSAGHNIVSALCVDEGGHKYTRYSLVNSRRNRRAA